MGAIPRLAVDAKSVTLHGGGIRRLLLTLLAEWAASPPPFHVVLLSPAPHEAFDSFDWSHVPFRRLTGPLRLPWYDQASLRMALQRVGADAFYSPYFDAPWAISLPYVVTMHDAVHLRFPQLYPWRLREYYGRLMRHHARFARMVVTDSEFSRQELTTLAGVPAARVRVCPPPLAAQFVSLGTATPRRPDGLPAGAYVLYTGGVEARKNLGALAYAYRVWHAATSDVPPLVLTGPAEAYGPLLRLAEDLGVRGSFRTVGHLGEGELAAAYAHALAVAYPTLYEGFGYPVLEAFACGVPVACSRRGSLPEVAGEAALYFDPEQPAEIAAALHRLAGDQALRERLISAGRERVRSFMGSYAPTLTGALVEALC